MVDVTITLLRLAFVAAVLTVALQQIFDTKLYQKYLGKGLDGEGSRYCRNFELRPWISTAVGIYLAFAFQMKALASGLGAEFMKTTGGVCDEAAIVDMILTGLIIGGGTKTIKNLAKQFAAAEKGIKDAKGGA